MTDRKVVRDLEYEVSQGLQYVGVAIPRPWRLARFIDTAVASNGERIGEVSVDTYVAGGNTGRILRLEIRRANGQPIPRRDPLYAAVYRAISAYLQALLRPRHEHNPAVLPETGA